MSQSHKFCLEMLKARKYNIINMTKEQIIATTPENKQIIVFFSNTIKFNVKNIQTYIAIMNELEIYHAIIIYKEGITSFTKKTVEQSIEMTFELFNEEDLQFNIIKHKYQPEFHKLEFEEAENIKKKFGTQFPILKLSDPICKFYNYKKGDIIKIKRKNGSIIYRIVKA